MQVVEEAQREPIDSGVEAAHKGVGAINPIPNHNVWPHPFATCEQRCERGKVRNSKLAIPVGKGDLLHARCSKPRAQRAAVAATVLMPNEANHARVCSYQPCSNTRGVVGGAVVDEDHLVP